MLIQFEENWKEHNIIIVDKAKEHTFSSSLLWMINDKKKKIVITRLLINLKRKEGLNSYFRNFIEKGSKAFKQCVE